LLSVRNLGQFQRFLRLCAARLYVSDQTSAVEFERR
jgi:hypothetical protein